MKRIVTTAVFLLVQFALYSQGTFTFSDNGDFFQNGKKIGRVVKTTKGNMLTMAMPEFTVYDVNGVPRFLFEGIEGKFIFLDDKKSFLPRRADAYAKQVAKFFAADSILTPHGYNEAYRSAFIKKYGGFNFSEKKERDYSAAVRYIENNILQGEVLIGTYEYRVMPNNKDVAVAVFDLNKKKVAFITTDNFVSGNLMAEVDMTIMDANQNPVMVFKKEFETGHLYRKGLDWIVQNGFLGAKEGAKSKKGGETSPVPMVVASIPSNTQTNTSEAPPNKVSAGYVALDYGYGPSDAKTVIAANQEWHSKNLNVDHFANGDLIPEAKTADEWKKAGENGQPAWCYYNNDPANGSKFGKLYNWSAVIDPRGLAPKDWHVASDVEWTTLIATFGGEVTAGTALRSASGWKKNGSNNSGMAILPGGIRDGNGVFSVIGDSCFLWSSSESQTISAWARIVDGDKTSRVGSGKRCGFSVRCLRDISKAKASLGILPDYSSTGAGVKVQGLTDGRPAQKAGILAGDTITAIGEYTVTDLQSYLNAVSKFERGQTVDVTIKRDNQTLKLSVNL